MVTEEELQKDDDTKQRLDKTHKVPAVLENFMALIDNLKHTAQYSQVSWNNGIKSELATKIEAYFDDPAQYTFGVFSSLVKDVAEFIDAILKGYFPQKKDVIQRVSRTKTNGNDLHYCIVLKRDTLKSRREVSQFLYYYLSQEVSQYIPVYFQFVPAIVADKIQYSEDIPLS